MRYAIWTAVSTEAQAKDDKVSLVEQERLCAKVGNDKGWTDTGLRYIVPGESRTRWIDLTTAAANIPALKQLLSDAEHNKFDILVMYDFNRLRDLLIPMRTYLTSLSISIYSHNQPYEPVRAGGSINTDIIITGMSDIFSKLQISDLKNKYNLGMPWRISGRGLPFHIPFGYSKPPERENDRTAIPVQDYRASLIVKMKDAFLAGQSLRQIVEMLDVSGIPSPKGTKWHPDTVRNILRNPFYAGVVRFGITKTYTDLRTGKRKKDTLPIDQVITGKGKHEPLWSPETHREILAEFKRRGHNYPGWRVSPLSGLMVCGVCGHKMWIAYDGKYQKNRERKRKMYRCPSHGHPAISFEEAIRKVGMLLGELARKYPADEPPPASTDTIDFDAQLDDLKTRRKLAEDAYLSRLFDKATFSKRVADIDAQLAELAGAMEERLEVLAERKNRIKALGGMAELGERLPEYLRSGNPQEINRQLSMFIKKIVLQVDGNLAIKLL